MKTLIILGVSAILAGSGLSQARADDAALPLLSTVFDSNMVLQRDHNDEIWGWSTPGAAVTVVLDAKTFTTIAGSDGKWTVTLSSKPAGGPYTIDIASGSKTDHLGNVMFGDVWLCTGQSNMDFGMGLVNNSAAEIAAAHHPNIRIFMVKQYTASTPQKDINGSWGSWEVCSPTSVTIGGWNGFSAVGYFFGRDLQEQVNVPIGLIKTCWGGTPAEAWTSPNALKTMPDFVGVDQELNQLNQVPVAIVQNTPGTLYDAMIAPFIPMGIKGVIWYQGEANVGRADQYRKLLPLMIHDWRSRWNQGDFPFLIVQLANLDVASSPAECPWADLREAQYKTYKTVSNTGLAVAVDIGDPNDIHPKNKQEVGRRLSLVALAQVYGKHNEYSGPEFLRQHIDNDKIKVSFTHIGGGLVVKGGYTLQGFTIAEEDRNFVSANAEIDGDSVVVSSPGVVRPKFVRYAWASNPTCSLYNAAGLPAIPFRTDYQPGMERTASLYQSTLIHRATGPVALDGTLAGFPDASPENITDQDVVLGPNDGGVKGAFRMCWDDNMLYLSTNVTDPTPMLNTHKAGLIYNGDGLEVFFGSDKIDQFGPLLNSDRQFLLSGGKVDGQFQSYVVGQQGSESPSQSGIKLIVVPDPDGKGYVIEAAIPFSELGFTPVENRVIRFDLGIDDSTDGATRLRQLMWNGTMEDSVDRSNWGRATFVK